MKSTNRILTAMAVAAALLLVAGCETPNINPLSGGAVKFKAVSTQEKLAKTKTVYGTAYVEEGYQRIDWVVNDHIRIYSDKAKFAYDDVLHADYAVERVFSEEGNNRSSFATIKPEGVLDGEGTVTNWQSANGLEWGSGDHKFFGLYPSPAYFTSKYTSADPTQVFALTGGETDADAREFTLTQPSVLSWLETDLDANRAIKPNMDYAYMGAMTRATEGNTVELQFKPMFTAFQFTFDRGDEANLKFHKFTLKTSDGSPLTGQYKVVMTVPNSGDPAWTPTALSATSSSIVANFGPIVADEGPAGIVLDNSDKPNVTFTVFALPLDYGEAATKGLIVEIDVTPQSTATKVTRALELKDSMGNWVTFAGGRKYNINFDVNSQWEYFIDDLEGFTLTYEGGAGNNLYDATALPAGFKSYRRNRNDNTLVQPVEYKLQYSMDDGATWTDGLPTWLENLKSGGADVSDPTAVPGSTTGAALTVDMKMQENSAPEDGHRTKLLEKSYTNFDLSTINVATGETVATTTANCYVVDGYGSFRFPLVYGNAIENGAVNTSAFTGTEPPESYGAADKSKFLNKFKDDADEDIISPYIEVQKDAAAEAMILWMDEPGLITDARVVGSRENAYMTFIVPEENIRQGNAVLAVKIGGNIAWSWHIWVTDLDMKASVKGPTGYSIAPYNLGWCDGRQIDLYEQRECLVRAVQKISGLASNASAIQQQPYDKYVRDNNVYYQWGRKDPLGASSGIRKSGNPPFTYSENKEIAYYDDDYPISLNISIIDHPQSIGSAIRHPNERYIEHVQYDELLDWCTEPKKWVNRWNSSLTTIDYTGSIGAFVTKTIYDPCPVGFKVGPTAAYSESINLNVLEPGKLNVRGFGFGALVFPATGYRVNQIRTNEISLYNYAYRVDDVFSTWTAGVARYYGTGQGVGILQSGSGTVAFQYTMRAAYHNSVRPIVDDLFSKGINADGENVMWD